MSQHHEPGYWRIKSIERWQLVLAYLILVAAMAVSIYQVHNLAQRADTRAAKAQEVLQQQRIHDSFKSEQVCSRTNQGQACADLFDRLARNITPQQRYRLGCQALAGLLPNKEVERIRAASHCPKAKPTARP